MIDIGQLKRDERMHTYTYGGQPVPGVTTVMADYIGQDFSMVDPRVLAEAALLGRRVHRMVELDVQGMLGIGPPVTSADVDFDLIVYFDSWRDFWQRSGFKPLMAEAFVYSARYGYAGQMDLLGEMNGELILPDLKRVARVSRTAAVQTAAYEQAARETFQKLIGDRPIKRAALQLKKDGRWELHPFTAGYDMRVFLSCLTIHNFKRKAL